MSAVFDMNRTTSLELACKTANIFAGEIYPFLASFEKLQPGVKAFSATEGVLVLSDLDLKGPLQAHAEWHFNLTATMQNIVVYSDALRDPAKISNGAFRISTEKDSKAIRKKIDVKTTKLSWGDNHLTLMGEINSSNHDILLEMTINADGRNITDTRNSFLAFWSERSCRNRIEGRR